MKQSIQSKFQEIKAIHARELAEQNVATSLDDIPASYELVSKAWLTVAVCRDCPNAEVVGFTLDKADEGTGSQENFSRIQ